MSNSWPFIACQQTGTNEECEDVFSVCLCFLAGAFYLSVLSTSDSLVGHVRVKTPEVEKTKSKVLLLKRVGFTAFLQNTIKSRNNYLFVCAPQTFPVFPHRFHSFITSTFGCLFFFTAISSISFLPARCRMGTGAQTLQKHRELGSSLGRRCKQVIFSLLNCKHKIKWLLFWKLTRFLSSFTQTLDAKAMAAQHLVWPAPLVHGLRSAASRLKWVHSNRASALLVAFHWSPTALIWIYSGHFLAVFFFFLYYFKSLHVIWNIQNSKPWFQFSSWIFFCLI